MILPLTHHQKFNKSALNFNKSALNFNYSAPKVKIIQNPLKFNQYAPNAPYAPV